MIRMMINLAINLATAALGLLLAAWLVPGVALQVSGFIFAVVIYTVAAAVFGPFVFNMARKYASALLGGIGLVSTLLALWVATLVPGGITITGFTAWAATVLLVWLVTALGGWFLVWWVFKRKAAARSAEN
jgi:hypothetical protein